MTHLVPGDTLDCLGPLGEPFVTSNNMLLIGGGVGIAPMLCIASHLKEGEEAQVILGFRNESETFWADLFKDTPVQSTSLLMMVVWAQKVSLRLLCLT